MYTSGSADSREVQEQELVEAMEVLTSILESDYGLKPGINAPMALTPGRSNSIGAGSGRLRKNIPSGRIFGTSTVVLGQDDPFALERKSEGSKSSQSSYGSKEDPFFESLYQDLLSGHLKTKDPESRYDEVHSGAPRDGSPPALEDLGGFGGRSPANPISVSFNSGPELSDQNHYVSLDPVYDELIRDYGLKPKYFIPAEMRAAHEQNPLMFGKNPDATSSGDVSSTFNEELLPGFSSGNAKSLHEPDPLIPLFDEPLGSSVTSASAPLVGEELLPGLGTDGINSRCVRETNDSNQDSVKSWGGDSISSSIPGTSPSFLDNLLNVLSDHQVPHSSSLARGPGNCVKGDRFDGFENLAPPVYLSAVKDSSRKVVEDAGRIGQSHTRPTGNANSIAGGSKSDEISKILSDSNLLFPSHSDIGKSANHLGFGPSEKQREDAPGWDFPSPYYLDPAAESIPRSKMEDPKDAWSTIEDFELHTRPSPLPPPSRRPPTFAVSKARFVTSSASTSHGKEDGSIETSPPPSYEQSVHMLFKSARDEERDRVETKVSREWITADDRERDKKVSEEKSGRDKKVSEENGGRDKKVSEENGGRDKKVSEEQTARVKKVSEENAGRNGSQEELYARKNDLESFFAYSVSSPTESSRPTNIKNISNAGVFGEPGKTSSRTATTASVDQWASVFGTSSKGNRESQIEQVERQQAGNVLDGEIKRWAAGKEGNLRALLSTLQYILWPNSGWIPISLVDLIDPNPVKKAYRKAALCIHPDKMHQKGATFQQKYIAEKVFDLLKEAYSKFNSNEIF